MNRSKVDRGIQSARLHLQAAAERLQDLQELDASHLDAWANIRSQVGTALWALATQQDRIEGKDFRVPRSVVDGYTSPVRSGKQQEVRSGA